MSREETLHARQGVFKLIVSCTVCAAHIPYTRSAKCATWYDRYLLLEKQFFDKFVVSQPCISNIWEGVESSSGLTTRQPDAVEASNKHPAAAVIIIMHHLHIGFAIAQRYECSFLS